MGQNSNIEWTKHTWNPWHGCKKVSDGCKYCYMYRDKDRYGLDPTIVVRSNTSTFNKPISWDKNDPGFVFTCSWSDFFIEEADKWRDDAWDIIRRTPNLTYQILTKRPERIMHCLPPDWGYGYANVWLGVSVENNKEVRRIKELIRVPAKIRFVSAEPLLENVDLQLWDHTENDRYVGRIDWVIVGGESGNNNTKWKARKCEASWIANIIGQCRLHGVSVFVKQLGTMLALEMGCKDVHGKKMDEWPEYIKIRQMPREFVKGDYITLENGRQVYGVQDKT